MDDLPDQPSLSENFLEPDQDSLLVEPDLTQYLFIHSSIDDAGLDPYEFRIFCHLRRRARQRVAWPGMRSIAQVTGISTGKVCIAIKSLHEKGFIRVTKRPNQTNLYWVGLPVECSSHEHPVHHMNTGRSPHERKGIQEEGTPIKEKEGASPPVTKEKDFLREGVRKEDKLDSTHSRVVGAQRPLAGVDTGLEAEAILTERPRGMPPLSAVKTELARMGFPTTDAEDVYDSWLVSGFKTKSGPITGWKASLRMKARNGWLFSQRHIPAKGPNFTPPTESEVLTWARAKHPRWTISYAKWCYRHFVATGWKHYKDPITSTERWQALMETELMKEAPR